MVRDPRADVARRFQVQNVGACALAFPLIQCRAAPAGAFDAADYHRRKITQKELKAPDEFTTLIDSARDFLVNNLTQVLVSAGIVVAVAVIVVGVYYYERHQDYLASAEFYSAITALNAGHNKEAEAQFKKLADEEPGRRLGRLARFYMASAYLGDNDLPKARDALVAFLTEEHDPNFTSLALTDLAVVYERMSDWRMAAGAYQQAAGVQGPEQVRAELGVARMLAKSGDKPQAIAAYRNFLAAHPFAAQRQDVIESLALLGAPAEPPSPTTAKNAGPLPVLTH